MNQNNEIKKWYLDNFKEFEKLVSDDSFDALRKNASAEFDSLPFPTKKDEEWKYTNISPILKSEYIPSPLFKDEKLKLTTIENYIIPNLDVHFLFLLMESSAKNLSNIGVTQDGVIIDSFYNQSISNSEFLKKHLSKKGIRLISFNHLNKAFTYDGFVIYIPKNNVD